MTAPADPTTFYRERVPAQFNRTLEAQQAAADGADAPVQRTLEGMLTVNATIRVLVDEGGSVAEHALNIEKGRMSWSESAAHAPFLTLKHDLESFAVIERESGDSILGFLGSLAGLGEAMKLTSQRIRNLAGLDGTLRFELTGDGGFTLFAHFGEQPIKDDADCSIRIAGPAYRQLQTGELNPQDAFMSGQIEVEGEMQMAMQLALAALSPD